MGALGGLRHFGGVSAFPVSALRCGNPVMVCRGSRVAGSGFRILGICPAVWQSGHAPVG